MAASGISRCGLSVAERMPMNISTSGLANRSSPTLFAAGIPSAERRDATPAANFLERESTAMSPGLYPPLPSIVRMRAQIYSTSASAPAEGTSEVSASEVSSDESSVPISAISTFSSPAVAPRENIRSSSGRYPMPFSPGAFSETVKRYEDTAFVKSTILREQRKFSDMNTEPGLVSSSPAVTGGKLRRYPANIDGSAPRNEYMLCLISPTMNSPPGRATARKMASCTGSVSWYSSTNISEKRSRHSRAVSVGSPSAPMRRPYA